MAGQRARARGPRRQARPEALHRRSDCCCPGRARRCVHRGASPAGASGRVRLGAERSLILLDAFALVAFLKDEPAAGAVEELLRSGVEISAVNLAEALDVLGRVDGVPPERLRELVEPLLVGPVTVTSVTARHSWRAAELRRRHCHNRRCPLSLADCFLLSVASGVSGELVTSDPDVLRVAREEGLEVRALPDSRGRSAPSSS